MGIFDFLNKNEKEVDPTRGLTLANLKVGWLFDYDLKTWEVSAYNKYDWGNGDTSDEWQIKSGDDVAYLEKESDDEDIWSLNRKIVFRQLGSAVRDHIIEKEDPPDELSFEGRVYYLDVMAAGHFLKNGQGIGVPMISWSYVDKSGVYYLGIEQWGEEEFEAWVGVPVQEYQFTNILPRF